MSEPAIAGTLLVAPGGRCLVLLALLCAVVSCRPFRIPAGDAGAGDDSGAGPGGGGESNVGPIADNDADITRYPDEKAVDHLLGVTRLAASSARTQAGASAGTVVAVLPPGASVDKIAVRRGWFLVVFIDPKDPGEGRRVLGWLAPTDFVAPSGKRPAVHCEMPRVAVAHGGAQTCELVCGACPVGEGCHGAGQRVTDGVPGAPVSYCSGVLPPLPTVAPLPGPAPAPTPRPRRPLDVKQQNGACPGGYGRCGAVCRLQCAADSDCVLETAHCAGGFCLGPGAQPCAR
jgi:hypothetical protein